MHMHRIPHPGYHTMFICWLFTMLCASFRVASLVSFSFVLELWGSVRLRPFVFFMDSFFFLAGSQARWSYPWNHYYLCFARCSLFCYAYAMMPATCLSCLPNCHVKSLTHLVLANRWLAMLPLLLSPSYSVASCRWRWSFFHVGTWICWDITISLI